MAGVGAGYDLSVSTFSPDGRVFQVEYASKAVDNGALCLAAACRNGVAFAVEKQKHSVMLAPGFGRRIYSVTKKIGMVIAGSVPDGRQLWHRARQEARSYQRHFGLDIPVRILAERVALYMHSYTLYWSVRPFGVTCIIGGVQLNEATREKEFIREVYSIDPSGCCSRYLGTAAGRNRPSAKTELEKLVLRQMDVSQLGEELARVLLMLREEGQSDSRTELEIGSVEETKQGPVFELWSREKVAAAVAKAKEAIEAMDRD